MSTAESFRTPEGALQRARLHIRAGRRRLRQGKTSAGLLTLYDALLFGLRWFLMLPEHRSRFSVPDDLDLTDERRMVGFLRGTDVLDSAFDLEAFEDLIDRASHEELADFDSGPVLERFEGLMLCLGVLPFDEAGLPPEDPATF